MSVKTHEPHKYYIVNAVLSNPVDEQGYDQIDRVFGENVVDNFCIGYLFSVKPEKFGMLSYSLNLYLIKTAFFDAESPDVIDNIQMREAYETFRSNLANVSYEELSKNYTKAIKEYCVFKNPPIDEWLKTKDNWIMKLANKISHKYPAITFDEALSEIALVVCKLFNRGTIYMGSLNYVENSVWNSLFMRARHFKHEPTLDKPFVIEGDKYVATTADGDEAKCTFLDLIPTEDKYFETEHYEAFKENIRKLMRPMFSEREIDQIFTQNKVGYLPKNTYRKLLQWRAKYPQEELRRLLANGEI